MSFINPEVMELWMHAEAQSSSVVNSVDDQFLVWHVVMKVNARLLFLY